MEKSWKEKMEQIRRCGTADVADTLSKRFGMKNYSVDGLSALRPGDKIVGPAYPLSYRKTGRPGEQPLPFYEVVQQCESGDVLVMEGLPDYIYGGDVVCRYVRHCGAAGLITDGNMRDIGSLLTMKDFPVFCKGSSSYISHYAGDVMTAGQPVLLHGVRICPGDILFGDEDGIVVIPREILDDVLYQLEDMVRIEDEYTAVFESAKPGEDIIAKLRAVGSQKRVRRE